MYTFVISSPTINLFLVSPGYYVWSLNMTQSLKSIYLMRWEKSSPKLIVSQSIFRVIYFPSQNSLPIQRIIGWSLTSGNYSCCTSAERCQEDPRAIRPFRLWHSEAHRHTWDVWLLAQLSLTQLEYIKWHIQHNDTFPLLIWPLSLSLPDSSSLTVWLLHFLICKQMHQVQSRQETLIKTTQPGHCSFTIIN